MASTPLHFAIGTVAGMAIFTPRLLRAWKSTSGLAPATRTWLLASWAFGAAASLPSLLRYSGVPESITGSVWMNVFLLYPWINSLLPQNHILGGAAMGLCVAIQYGWTLLAIIRCHHR